jgi:hypothetical protein
LQIGEPELRAAIGEGRYRPAAAQRLFEILWSRREKILRAYLRDVPAIDYFRVESGALCWDDLWIRAGLDGERSAEYSANGRLIARDEPPCTPVGDGYRVVALRVKRNGERKFSREVRVHLIDRRVVGVER